MTDSDIQEELRKLKEELNTHHERLKEVLNQIESSPLARRREKVVRRIALERELRMTQQTVTSLLPLPTS